MRGVGFSVRGIKQHRESLERQELPGGVQAEPRPPKGFPLLSALRMVSADPTILLIVDYNAAIGEG